jgi:hypothetical protein
MAGAGSHILVQRIWAIQPRTITTRRAETMGSSESVGRWAVDLRKHWALGTSVNQSLEGKPRKLTCRIRLSLNLRRWWCAWSWFFMLMDTCFFRYFLSLIHGHYNPVQIKIETFLWYSDATVAFFHQNYFNDIALNFTHHSFRSLDKEALLPQFGTPIFVWLLTIENEEASVSASTLRLRKLLLWAA